MKTELNEQQETAVNEPGNVLVTACPGSGKTYSVAARLAHLISDWNQEHQGIAVISFTNAAWQEIQRQINNHFQIEGHIRYPHFLGTIDSFINHYIFLPFGHLIMGCKKRPILVGEPHGSWSSGRYERDYDRYFNLVSFGARNEIVFPKINGLFHFGYTKFYKNDGTESKHSQNIRDVKNVGTTLGTTIERGIAEMAKSNEKIRKSWMYRLTRDLIKSDRRNCESCGTRSHLEMHHIVPLSNGGTEMEENIKILCHTCHMEEHERC